MPWYGAMFVDAPTLLCIHKNEIYCTEIKTQNEAHTDSFLPFSLVLIAFLGE